MKKEVKQPHLIPYPYGPGDNEMTEEEIRESSRAIPWDVPVMLSRIGLEHEKHFGCRLCIARYGIHGSAIDLLPRTVAEFEEHRRTFHP